MGSRLNGAAGILTREAILRDVAPGEMFALLTPTQVLACWGTLGHVPLMLRTRQPIKDEQTKMVTVVRVVETAVETRR